MKSSRSVTSDAATISAIATRVVLGLWVGSLWTVGYLAAPTLFNVIEDRALAGEIAGRLFLAEAVISVICGALVLIPAVFKNGWMALRQGTELLALLTLILVVSSEWPVGAWIDATRLADGSPGPGFGVAHGVAATLYLFASITGLAALWNAFRRAPG